MTANEMENRQRAQRELQRDLDQQIQEKKRRKVRCNAQDHRVGSHSVEKHVGTHLATVSAAESRSKVLQG
jgi:hypothetical protein